ncbi:MAG: GNAT family N-acetyltransferase [Sediminibacterium sp.]
MELQPLHLKNELVELIPLQPNHFKELFAVASDPLIWEQHPNPDRYKQAVFENFFKGAIESKGAFLIKNVQTGQAIGSSRFYDYTPDKSEIKIGYTFFSRDCWGKPFNKEVKKLMIDYALMHVNTVVFHVGAENIRSQKAMEKLGALKISEVEVAYFGEATRLNFVYAIDKETTH